MNDRAERIQALNDAIEIIQNCIIDLSHQVHSPGCKCFKTIKKLRRVINHLVMQLSLEATI
jgi:hypothetical protein